MTDTYYVAVVTAASQYFEGPFEGEDGAERAHRVAARLLGDGHTQTVVIGVR